MAIGEFLLGSPGRIESRPRFSPEQQNLQSLALKNAQGILGQGMAGFEPIEERARQQFRTRTIPSLAERFTALGGSPGGSSVFAGLLGEAGAGLESDLAAQRSQYQQGLLSQLLGLGMLEGQNEQYIPGESGLLQQLLPLALKAAAAYFTGGASLIPEALAATQEDGGMGEAASPFVRQLQGQTGNQLLNQAQQRQIGLPGILGTRRSPSQAMNALRQGGFGNIQNLLGEAALSNLGPTSQRPEPTLEQLLGSILNAR